MSRALSQIIEGVYTAFRVVPRPRTIEGCPHCLQMEPIHRFLDIFRQQPLRKLTADDLRLYAFKAMTTVGCAEDFQYFLPRILDLEADGSLGIEPEILAQKIDMAGLEFWNDERRCAVLNWINAMFEEVLRADQSGTDVDAWLCALGQIHVDLRPYLERLLHVGPTLISLFEHNALALEQGGLTNGFWDDIPAAKQQVIEWFASTETKAAIDKQYGVMCNVDPKGLRPS